MAKPSPGLFLVLTERLAAQGIAARDCLFVGNDPLQDIVPAAAAGFQTALYTGHPSSLRPGACQPGFTLRHWRDLPGLASSEMRED
jgi:FMN phosphatase YigB (HAD superfamily)